MAQGTIHRDRGSGVTFLGWLAVNPNGEERAPQEVLTAAASSQSSTARVPSRRHGSPRRSAEISVVGSCSKGTIKDAAGSSLTCAKSRSPFQLHRSNVCGILHFVQ